METKDARPLSPCTQEAIRIKAVKTVVTGKSQVEVAKIFGITRQALGKWINKYREDGAKSLKAKK